jgi:hypothetical protein
MLGIPEGRPGRSRFLNPKTLGAPKWLSAGARAEKSGAVRVWSAIVAPQILR